MLALPSSGIKRSIEKHNVDHDVLCDWLEASVLFNEPKISGSEFVDLVVSEHFYDDQDFAWELYDTLLLRLQHRADALGSAYPIACSGRVISSSPAKWFLFT